MKTLFAASLLVCLGLTACGGGGDASVAVAVAPVVVPVQATYEYLNHPTISGLEYLNSVTGPETQLTTSVGGYNGYTGGDTVSFFLGDILLFTLPGELPRPFLSLYDANRYSNASLYSDTAVENLMAFLMAIDDDGDYRNGIQVAYPVRAAARGLNLNFNQTAFDFRNDPAVQYATAVLSGNTFYGQRPLVSPGQAQFALQTP
ncbi:MAG: hypothetical protein H7332_17300 [Bdellovibrionales bacterium]|nr:hypothetical protein [Ramlibacter sp.]